MYVEKTGDTKFLASRFGSPGPLGASAQPSIEAAAQIIAADRTGPGGIIGETNDIDANRFWVSDNYEALLGLAGYEYLAKVMGNTAQEQWAAGEYNSLLQAVNSTLSSTISSSAGACPTAGSAPAARSPSPTSPPPTATGSA